jgi:hypothetical protein
MSVTGDNSPARMSRSACVAVNSWRGKFCRCIQVE